MFEVHVLFKSQGFCLIVEEDVGGRRFKQHDWRQHTDLCGLDM